MLKKGFKINSILTGSCPKCQQESMYVVKNPYKLSTLFKMHEKCSHCNLHYEMEPSFFYGAMYMSYGITIAIGVAIFVIAHVFMSVPIKESFIAIVIGLIVLMPVTARLARNSYINMFVSYDKNWKENKN